MAHVCTACGVDCSRLRAPPDPVYALPVVVCPGCGAAFVRRLTRERWTGGGPGELVRSLWLLTLRALALLVLSGLSMGVAAIGASEVRAWLSPTAGSFAPGDPIGAEWSVIALAALMACPILVALSLRWTLGHHTRTRRTLAWLGCICLLMWGVPNFATAAQALFEVGPRYYANGSSLSQPTPLRFEFGDWLIPMLLALMGVAVWTLGPLGDRFGRYTRQQAWLTLLSRARRRRGRTRS